MYLIQLYKYVPNFRDISINYNCNHNKIYVKKFNASLSTETESPLSIVTCETTNNATYNEVEADDLCAEPLMKKPCVFHEDHAYAKSLPSLEENNTLKVSIMLYSCMKFFKINIFLYIINL